MNTENNMNPLAVFIGFILIVAIMSGVYYYCYVLIPEKNAETYINDKILNVLNTDGIEYLYITDKNYVTKEDFEAKLIYESDYKPIYEVTLYNNDILYIGFIRPGGYVVEGYKLHRSLEKVKEALEI